MSAWIRDLDPHIQILRNQLLPWATGVFGRNFVYIKDNAPHHTARDMAAFLDQQDVEVEVMDWPARSPDMNPIEHVWHQMSVWIRDLDEPPPPPPTHTHTPTTTTTTTSTTTATNTTSTVAELINAVRQAWAAVRPGRVRTLVESMPHCVRALLAARGGHTWYECRGQKGNIMFDQYVVNCISVPYWSLVLVPNVN